MSTVRRYTAEEMRAEAEWEGYKMAREHVPEMLRQASETEAQNEYLLDVLADVNTWLCRNHLDGTAHQLHISEALSTFRGEDA